jgi:isoprenylcysteine carboxyl methyltransferase (ICMT) family protein YpbQ
VFVKTKFTGVNWNLFLCCLFFSSGKIIDRSYDNNFLSWQPTWLAIATSFFIYCCHLNWDVFWNLSIFILYNEPTNAQLSHKLSHPYMFQHYYVILREFTVSTLLSYISVSVQSVIIVIKLYCCYSDEVSLYGGCIYS